MGGGDRGGGPRVRSGRTRSRSTARERRRDGGRVEEQTEEDGED